MGAPKGKKHIKHDVKLSKFSKFCIQKSTHQIDKFPTMNFKNILIQLRPYNFSLDNQQINELFNFLTKRTNKTKVSAKVVTFFKKILHGANRENIIDNKTYYGQQSYETYNKKKPLSFQRGRNSIPPLFISEKKPISESCRYPSILLKNLNDLKKKISKKTKGNSRRALIKSGIAKYSFFFRKIEYSNTAYRIANNHLLSLKKKKFALEKFNEKNIYNLISLKSKKIGNMEQNNRLLKNLKKRVAGELPNYNNTYNIKYINDTNDYLYLKDDLRNDIINKKIAEFSSKKQNSRYIKFTGNIYDKMSIQKNHI